MPYSSFSIHSKKPEIKSGRTSVSGFCASPLHDQTIQQYSPRAVEDTWFDMASFRPLEFSLDTSSLTFREVAIEKAL